MIARSLLVGVLCAGIASLGARVSARPDQPALLATPFAAGLAGWRTVGECLAAADATVACRGMASVRIDVPAGVGLRWQQLARDFGASAGDEFRAVVWLRTCELSDGSGAYMAVEFVDREGLRVGVLHSRLGLATGRNRWEALEIEGAAPERTAAVRLSLVLNSHGAAWFAAPELWRLGAGPPSQPPGEARTARVRTDRPSPQSFIGVGFHAFHHTFSWSETDRNEVIYKRWRELRPSFARLNDHRSWDGRRISEVSRHLLEMRRTGTQLDVTTWDPPDTQSDAELSEWARVTVDRLARWRAAGATNLRWYCMTNELTLGRWGALAEDMPRFRRMHQALWSELGRRRIPIGLLAPDASPAEWWWTVDWAVEQMDAITAVYGGHHYINDRSPEDPGLYRWFLRRLQRVVAAAQLRGKGFILGEFGSRQDGTTRAGVMQDRCVYYETPEEPEVGLQLGDVVIAGLNAGIQAMGYWTFMDLPDDYAPGYINKWGLFRCSGDDRTTRAPYYAYGLLARALRGPARTYPVECSDARLRVGALRSAGGAWSVVAVNRNTTAVRVSVLIPGERRGLTLRRWTYDPAHVPTHPFGDLQAADGAARLVGGVLRDTIPARCLRVYTSGFRGLNSHPVTGLLRERLPDGRERLRWRSVTDPLHCYYRVFRCGAGNGGGVIQVGSTIATTMLLPAASRGIRYAVGAVDTSGNLGPLAAR